MARYDDLNTTAIAYTTFISSILLVIIILLGRALCYVWIETEDQRKLSTASYEVSDRLIGEQKSMLSGYQTVRVELPPAEGADPAAAPQYEERVRIPIEKAKELLLKDLAAEPSA